MLTQAFTEIIPGLELTALLNILAGVGLASLRIGSFFLASPLFGYKIIPLQVRVVVAFATSFLIFSTIPIPNILELAGLKIVLVIFQELVIGVSSGLILKIFFSSAELAGEKIAASTGLSFAGLVDPESGAQTPVVSQIFSFFMLLTFLSLNGHLLVIAILLESYKVLPIGATNINMSMIQLGIDAGGLMFKFGALIMLPVVVGITLLNVVIGIVTRSAPTLNLFSFGFPITMLGTFIVLYLSISNLGFAFSDLIDSSLDHLMTTIESLKDG